MQWNRSTQEARIVVAQSSAVALRGAEMMQDVVSRMPAINNSAARIADIIGTIDGIAFQTNILALNTAVEAARAGERRAGGTAGRFGADAQGPVGMAVGRDGLVPGRGMRAGVTKAASPSSRPPASVRTGCWRPA